MKTTNNNTKWEFQLENVKEKGRKFCHGSKITYPNVYVSTLDTQCFFFCLFHSRCMCFDVDVFISAASKSAKIETAMAAVRPSVWITEWIQKKLLRLKMVFKVHHFARVCVVHFTHFTHVCLNKWGDTHAWSSSSSLHWMLCHSLPDTHATHINTIVCISANLLSTLAIFFRCFLILCFLLSLLATATATELRIADIYVVLSLSTSCHLDLDTHSLCTYAPVACACFAIRKGDLFPSVNLQLLFVVMRNCLMQCVVAIESPPPLLMPMPHSIKFQW